MDAIQTIGNGLKCDNSECEYVDPTVKQEEYENYIGEPCPVCGQNLLTKADYDAHITMQLAISLLNNAIGSQPEGSLTEVIEVNYNGDGKPTMTVLPNTTEEKNDGE